MKFCTKQNSLASKIIYETLAKWITEKKNENKKIGEKGKMKKKGKLKKIKENKGKKKNPRKPIKKWKFRWKQ